jgi:putative ABC transport system permease protein
MRIAEQPRAPASAEHEHADTQAAEREHADAQAAEREAALDELRVGGISLPESARIAIGSLMVNKLRTLLTALGVIIGVAAVVALLAIGRGSQDAITASITANGANLLTVRPGATNSGGVGGQVGSGQTLTNRDAAALADPANVPDALYVSPEFQSFAQIVAGSQNTNARVTGALPAYMPLHNISVAEGEFISDDHNTSAASVVVLGANVAATLFPDGPAVGQALRLNRQSFKVIGVLASQGGTGFGSMDDGVIVPLSTAQRKLFGGRAIGSGGSPLVSNIVIQARDKDSIDAALSEITATIRDQHGLPADGTGDDFSVLNQQDILNTVAQTAQVLTLFLSAIAAISLVVGGIGIMNIMLVSVRERTREIGLRKALGARERDILTQFLIEALSLSALGGLLGLLLGMLIAWLVNLSGQIRATVSIDSVVLAIGFAMMVGLFFGIEPARRAAKLDPIEALRYD